MSNIRIKIGLLVLFVVMCFTIWALITSLASQKAETKRWENNYISALVDHAQEQQLTKKELQKYYSKIDSLANKLEIKTKNIERVIEMRYRFKDTTIIHATTVIDTIKQKIEFKIVDPKGCYSVTGFVASDSSVWGTGLEINDKLSTFVYQNKPKWVFGMKKFWKKSLTEVKVFSECKQDTICIEKNIKIIKK